MNGRINMYKQMHAGRSLCDLGVLLQRVKEEQAQLGGQTDDTLYRSFLEGRREELGAELQAIYALIDDHRYNRAEGAKSNPTFREIQAELAEMTSAGDVREFSSLTELTNEVDRRRHVGERTTYRYLNRKFGKEMPKDPGDFTKFILKQV